MSSIFGKRRSSAKQVSTAESPTTTTTTTTATKDRAPVITTAAISISSNCVYPPTNSTSNHTMNQKSSNSNASNNNNNESVGRRLLNLLRFNASRQSSSVRASRQRDKNPSRSSKQEQQQQQHFSTVPVNDNTSITSSLAVVKDDQSESTMPLPSEHVINIISSTTATDQLSNNQPEMCSLCYQEYPLDEFERLTLCSHSYCVTCLKSYLRLEITEGRVTLNCPHSDCPERIHPSDITRILQKYPDLIAKYEQFMVRRVLQSISDTRWCPAPDCGFAVIASGCASCPEIQCLRPGCNTSFCYHCKAVWHPNKTCEDAARENTSKARSNSFMSASQTQQRNEIKQCPRCQASILKMDDGSCNHMTCPICEAEFCWLCGREISDLHYLSPSGCTFWGKKQWSRKKVILWQVATLIGAPVIIALIAGVAVPAVIIGVPIWAGRKIYRKFNKPHYSKIKRNILVTLGVLGGAIVSPIIAALAVSIGVPILLAYVYGVIPISLCRTGGCGVGNRHEMSDNDTPNIDNILPFSFREVPFARTILNDNQSVMTHPTIGGDSTSLSNSVTHLIDDRSNESTKALPGTGAVSLCESLPPSNRLEVQAETSDCKSFDIESITISEKSSKTMDSLKALAGSIKDACTVPGVEFTNDLVCGGAGDVNGRKSSLLSSASDYARSIGIEQNTSWNRAGSPNSDKTVSFFDERVKVKPKPQTDRY